MQVQLSHPSRSIAIKGPKRAKDLLRELNLVVEAHPNSRFAIDHSSLIIVFTDKFDKEDYYLTPEGFIVFTEKYHLKRGYCCHSGCRHCPYGYDKKTGLIKGKEKDR